MLMRFTWILTLMGQSKFRNRNLEGIGRYKSFSFYEEKFRALQPENVLNRLSGVTWDGKEFTLTLLGRDFAISHPDYAIRALDGGTLPPLPTQTFLLRYLLENHGTVLSREKILEKIWGYEIYGETRTVDVHIRTLRQKLGEAGKMIETVRGVGYRIGEET